MICNDQDTITALVKACPASRLHIIITDEPTLRCPTTSDGATHGLLISISDETALAATPACGRPAIGLAVAILDEPAL
jgi:hypothetical protein